jgi:hypothetical protein
VDLPPAHAGLVPLAGLQPRILAALGVGMLFHRAPLEARQMAPKEKFNLTDEINYNKWSDHSEK